MTYKDHFVVEVKSNGKILRIKDDAVFLPFGSEYSILLKNLNTRKALVHIQIDGEDVLDGHGLILEPNNTTELQGFLKNTVAKNKFKFIQKTKQISDYRGDKPDDGLIRVEFAFEEPQPTPYIEKTIKEVHHYYHSPITYTYYGSSADWSYNSKSFTPNNTNEIMACNQSSLGVRSVSELPNIDEGITVKGSEINQSFFYGTIGTLQEPEVIVIQLKGIKDSGNVVAKPVTTKDKLTCSSCGTKSKSSFKFCPNCGTFLD